MQDVWDNLILLSATQPKLSVELFATITWQIWNVRNYLLFEISYPTLGDNLLQAEVLLYDFATATSLPIQRHENLLSILPPPLTGTSSIGPF